MSFQVFTPQGNIHRLYLSIIEDLTENIRDSFLDEGLDESHLNEFAHVWQVKLDSTKALENLNGAEHPRHNVAMPITTMIAPSHNSVLANRIEESRLNYQQKLAQNLSNMNSKSEPLDFSKYTGFNLGKIRFQGHEQQSASSLLTMRERLQNAAAVRPQGTSATISQSTNILNRHQLRNNLISGGTLHDSNTSNLLNLRRSAHELLKNQTNNQNKLGMNSVIKEEPRFYLQHRPLTNQKLYEASKSNMNEHDMLLSQAKSNYSQQLINAAAAAVVSSPSTYPNSRHQQQHNSFNQQNVQTAINLNTLLQQHHPALTSHQHMYIKQLLLDQQLKSATNNSGGNHANVGNHQFYPHHQQRNQLQNNSHQQKRKHSDDDELDDDEDNVGDGGGGSAKISHNSTFPQFDGQVDEQSINRTRPLDAPISGEDTSDEDDDELDRFASVIAPEFSESNDAFVTKEDSEPLNSDDDVSEDDPTDLFDTDNIVVCQFDKINRSKARWKFLLKEGIMNIRGKDYVFSKAQGEADW